MSEASQQFEQSSSSVATFAPVAVYRLKQYASSGIMQQVSNMLIRPPRFVYNPSLLLPGRKFQQKFSYQHYQIPFPISIYVSPSPKYILLYLHGYLHLKQLPQNVSLACFDFNGCGLRQEQNFITLGKNQAKEVDLAVQWLSQKFTLPVVGWGRSMGAVSLLMSTGVDVMVVDSPFASLQRLCKEISMNFLPASCCWLVHCFFPCIFCCVRKSVQDKSGMDPKELQVIKAMKKQPKDRSILILAGTQDSMINYSHGQSLFDAFKGQSKKIILFEGTHNSTRPNQVMQQSFEFIEKSLKKKHNYNYQMLTSSKRALNIQKSQKQFIDQSSTLVEQSHIKSLESQTTQIHIKSGKRAIQPKQVAIKAHQIKQPMKQFSQRASVISPLTFNQISQLNRLQSMDQDICNPMKQHKYQHMILQPLRIVNNKQNQLLPQLQNNIDHTKQIQEVQIQIRSKKKIHDNSFCIDFDQNDNQRRDLQEQTTGLKSLSLQKGQLKLQQQKKEQLKMQQSRVQKQLCIIQMP